MKKLLDYVAPRSPVKQGRGSSNYSVSEQQIVEKSEQEHECSMSENSINMLEKIQIDTKYWRQFQRLEKIEERNRKLEQYLLNLQEKFEAIKQNNEQNDIDVLTFINDFQ